MSTPNEPQSGSAARLREVAAGLAEMGLVTRLHRTRAGTDLTATLHLPGYHDIEVIADEDGYTELRYWASLSSTATAAVANIGDILEVLKTSQSLASAQGGIAAGCRLRWRGHRTCGRRWHDGAPRPSGRARTNPRSGTPSGQPSRQPSAPRRLTGPPGTVAPQPPVVPLPRRRFPQAPAPRPHQVRTPSPRRVRLPRTQTYPRATKLRRTPTAPGSGKTPSRSRALAHSRQAIARCRETEGRDVNGNYGDRWPHACHAPHEAQLEHGQLVEDTEKFALKDPDRFKEKFAKTHRCRPRYRSG